MPEVRPLMSRTARVTSAVVLACVAVATAQTSATPADTARKDIDAKLAALRKRLADRPPASANATERSEFRSEMSRLKNALDRIAEAMDNGNIEQAARAAGESSRNANDAEIRDELTALAKALDAFVSVEAADTVVRTKALLGQLTARLKQAKSADELSPIVEELETASRQMSRGNNRNEQLAMQVRGAFEVVRRYAQLLAAEADGATDRALVIAEELESRQRSDDFASPGREVIRTKAAALRKMANEAFQKSMAEKSRVVADAKTSADLQPVLSSLQEQVNGGRNMGRPNDRYQVEYQALRTWARVLDAEQQGKVLTALETINQGRQVRYDNEVPSLLVPPSLVTAKVAALQQAALRRGDAIVDPNLKALADTLTNAKTLDELIRSIDPIDGVLQVTMQNGNDADNRPVLDDLRRTIERVRLLAAMRSAGETREWGQFWQQNQGFVNRGADFGRAAGGRWDAKLQEMRQGLLRQAIDKSAELANLKLKIKADQPLDAAMLGNVDEALAAKDYSRAAMVLQAYFSFAYGFADRSVSPAGLRGDLEGLTAFAQGTNFETARDPQSAVMAYRQVLRVTGPRVPTAAAAARIAAIAADHPNLFDPESPEGRRPAPRPTTTRRSQ